MTVQIEIDETILLEIDNVAKNAQKSRYELVNEILIKGLRRRTVEQKIQEFEESYRRVPISPSEKDELEAWEDEQVWSD